MKEKKRTHTHSLQLMKKLVSSSDTWEAEDTGSRPSDDSLKSFREERIDTDKLVEPVSANAKPEEVAEGKLQSGWSASFFK